MVAATSTEQSWPFDNQLIDENAWEVYFSPLAEDGVFGSPGSRVGQVYADGSGMQVKRRSVSGWVHGWYFTDTAEKPIPIDPNPSTFPRTDRIVERRNLVTNATWTDVVKGTAAVGAPAPALTQTPGGIWEIGLGRVLVDPGAGVAGNNVQVIDANKVSDDRQFQSLRMWRVTNRSQLPITGVPLWQRAVDAVGNEWRFTGTQWLQVAAANDVPPTTWLGGVYHGGLARNLVLNTSASGGWYKIENGTVTGATSLKIADSSAAALVTGDWLPLLPVTPKPLAFVPLGTFTYQPGNDSNYWETGTLAYRSSVSPGQSYTLSGDRPYASNTSGVFHAPPHPGDVYAYKFTYQAA